MNETKSLSDLRSIVASMDKELRLLFSERNIARKISDEETRRRHRNRVESQISALKQILRRRKAELKAAEERSVAARKAAEPWNW